MAHVPEATASGAHEESATGALERSEEFLFHLYRGSDLLQDDRFHEAKAELERALALRPADAGGQDMLAAVYYRLGLYDHAIRLYEDLKQRARAPAAVTLNLALCRLKLGDTHGARRELEELTRRDPSHRRAWGYLGVCRHALGDARGAEEAFLAGGHTQLAERVARGRSLMPTRPPRSLAPSAARAVADALRSLDPSAVDLVLAPDDGRAADGPWHAVELGASRSASPKPPRRTTPLFPFEATSVRDSGPPSAGDIPLPLLVGSDDANVTGSVSSAGHGEVRSASRALDAQRWADRPPGIHTVGARFVAAVVDAERAVFVAARSLVASFAEPTHCERLAFGATSFVALRANAGASPRPRATAVLGASYGHEMTLFDLDGLELSIAVESVIAFAASLSIADAVLASPTLARRFVRFRGDGRFVFQHRVAWSSIDLSESGPCVVRASHLIGWTGHAQAELLDDAPVAEGRRGLVRLTGAGSALVLTPRDSA